MPKKLAVITGDKKLNKGLARLTGPLQKKAIRQTSKPAIKPIMQQSRGNAKTHKRSGQMAKSIKARSIPRSRSRIGSRVTTRAEDFGGKFYSAFVMLGWKAGKAKRQIKGTEDMGRAVETKKDAVVRDYKSRLWVKIKELAKA